MGAGYKTMSDLLIDFRKIGCLPKSRGLSCLDNGNSANHINIQKWCKRPTDALIKLHDLAKLSAGDLIAQIIVSA